MWVSSLFATYSSWSACQPPTIALYYFISVCSLVWFLLMSSELPMAVACVFLNGKCRFCEFANLETIFCVIVCWFSICSFVPINKKCNDIIRCYALIEQWWHCIAMQVNKLLASCAEPNQVESFDSSCSSVSNDILFCGVCDEMSPEYIREPSVE